MKWIIKIRKKKEKINNQTYRIPRKAMSMMKGWMRMAVPKTRATSARTSNGFSVILLGIVVIHKSFWYVVNGSSSVLSISVKFSSSLGGPKNFLKSKWFVWSGSPSLINIHIKHLLLPK